MKPNLVLPLLVVFLINTQRITNAFSPPSPQTTLSSSPTLPTTVDDDTFPNFPWMRNATWQNTLQNLLANRAARNDDSSSSSLQAQLLTRLLSELPGVMQGLTGANFDQNDVGGVLAELFANPGTAGIPAWIEFLTQGGSPLAAAPADSADSGVQGLLMNVTSQLPGGQALTLLSQLFSDVTKGLSSLNLPANASVTDIVSAVMNNPALLSSLSTDSLRMLTSLAGNSGSLQDLLRSSFPLDPRSQCAADLRSWASGLTDKQMWAIQMFDAMGKLQSGVLTGQSALVGDYEECRRVSFTNQTTRHTLKAHFCPMVFAIPKSLGSTLGGGFLWMTSETLLTMHLCLPESCQVNDIYGLFEPTLKLIGSEHKGTYCVGPRDMDGDGGFIGVTLMLVVLALLCAAGTVYGVILDKRTEKQRQNKEKQAPVAMTGIANQGFNGNVQTTGVINYGFNSNSVTPVAYIPQGGGSTTNGPVVIDGSPSKEDGGVKPAYVMNGSDVTTGLPANDGERYTSLPACYAQHSEDGEKKGKLAEVEEGEVTAQRKAAGSEVVSKDTRAAESQAVQSPSQPMTPQQSVLSQILLGFSVLKNGRKVLACHQNSSDISCLHGIRVFSICWVVLGHAFSMLDPVTGNAMSKVLLTEDVSFMGIIAGMLAVDTFFLLSGTLSAFLFLRATKKSGLSVSGVVLYYIHRVWRLTPLYAVILAVYVGIFPYLKEGPYMYLIGMDSESTCREYWWSNLLYINNIVSIEHMCFGWSWYLANDMQFSFLAPLVIIPWTFRGKYKRVAIIGFVLCAGLILTHMIATGVISSVNDIAMFSGNPTKTMEYMEKIYFPPWTRVGPYAVGLLLGYVLFVTPAKVKMDKLSVILGWIMATGVALVLVYVRYDNLGHIMSGPQWNTSQQATFESLDKVLWAACVSWVIFACSMGYGGFVNTLLSWSAWQPLSRLTYGVYLTHCVILYVLGGNVKKPLYLDNWTATTLFLSATVLSYLVSFTFSMLVEAPTLGLEKAVLGKIFRSKK